MQIPGSIIILGGGTAGWMAANSLLHAWGDRCQITLIESDAIPTVGVGEGSTPYLKHYFKQLGICEAEWMPACDATYKAGISFEGWSEVPGYERYFHPFFSQLDLKPAEAFFYHANLRRRGHDISANPDDYFVAASMVRLGLAPVSTKPLPFEVDYGYHFDAGKLASFLAAKAKAQGLRHLIDTVAEVTVDKQGNLASLLTSRHGALSADFFIDCSGFSGRLIQQALGQTLHSYQEQLFNNAAVAMPTSTPEQINSQTRSIALSNGWMWQIPLTSRQGNGYVYSRDFISADQAETELRQALGVDDNANIEARHLTMKIGRLTQHWYCNCLAVGLSQGFIEPLEATALMLIQFTLERFIQAYPQVQNNPSIQQSYNQQMCDTFDGVRDYIVAHYQLNTRSDSDYWLACRDNPSRPQILTHLLEAWEQGADFDRALNHYEMVYQKPSWYCIFAGMGRFPKRLNLTPEALQQQPLVSQAKHWCERAAQEYFTKHSGQLRQLYGKLS